MTAWLACNAVGAMIIVILRQKPHNSLWLQFLAYLLVHVTLSALWLINRNIEVSKDTHDCIVWFINQLLLVAAYVYFRIAVLLIFCKRDPYHAILTGAASLSLSGWSIVMFILTFTLKLHVWGSVVVFTYYLPCALFALVSLYIVCYRVGRKTLGSYEPAPEEEKTGRCACLDKVLFSCIGRSRVVVFLGAFGGTMGIVDYLIPAAAHLGHQMWESTFLSRILDCIFFLPLIIPCLLWLDCPANYPMEVRLKGRRSRNPTGESQKALPQVQEANQPLATEVAVAPLESSNAPEIQA